MFNIDIALPEDIVLFYALMLDKCYNSYVNYMEIDKFITKLTIEF